MKKGPRSRHLRAGLCFILCILFAGVLVGQQPPAPQPAPPPLNLPDDPLLKNFRWRAVGPASMGGRIDDIAVVESNPYVIYVGFATGGVWKTVNNGTTWEPIFDTYSSSSIGDIAVYQVDPNIIWVGTGEPNNRQSSSFGDGIYKSTDGGKTFTNMGLKESQTIARIVCDPKDPNVVYVAALGHLFGPNPERGVFKTTDGGKTWAKVKFIDDDTGFTDFAMDPVDSKILYAASYQRRRTPWGFNGGGPGSGIWKTIDAGKTWTKLTGNGLPTGNLGRIGLDVSRSNPNVLCAQIEKDSSGGVGGEPGGAGGGGGGGRGGQGGQAAAQPPKPPDPEKSGIWRSDDKGKTWKIVSSNNNRPMYYSQIRVDPSNDQIAYTGGLQFSKSLDGGKTFQNLAGVAHSDHHAIWIDPKNGNHLIIGNDGGLNFSYDQGATWEFVNNIPAGQFYAVAADMRKPYYVYGGLQDNGSWGGPSATRSGPGITNADWFRVGGGDGFYTQVDPTDHNILYVESQNGAVNRLDLKTGRSTMIRPRGAAPPRGQRAAQQTAEPTPETPPTPPAAPPGAQAAVEPQMMGFFRGAQTPNIVPAPPVGEVYRFNWNAPIQLSPHNPRIVYVGANRLFKSLDRGDTWTASPDLTKQIDRNKLSIMGVPGDKPMFSKNDGVSFFGTITTLAESPVLPGVLWVGTDDGNVQVSKDGGATWTNVAEKIADVPKTHQVSRVEPSHFDAGTCYVTFDGHRSDDMKPYVYMTTDFGATWRSLASNLPVGNVNVIREDPKNKDLLFIGTEYGIFVSLNCGAEWKRFMPGLPTVRVDDLLIHPRNHDLIAATHGRSIYIMDDVTPLELWSDKVAASDAFLFDVRTGTLWLQDNTLSRSMGGAKNFIGANPQPGTAINYYLKSDAAEDVKVSISDIDGKVVRNLTGSKNAGINRVSWNLRGNPPQRAAGLPPAGAAPAGTPPAGTPPAGTLPAGMQAGMGAGGGGGGMGRFGALMGTPLEPGIYVVKLTVGGKDYTTKVRVEEDSYKNQ